MSPSGFPKEVPLFEHFTIEEIEGFIAAAETESVPEGHVFLKMGDLNSSFFLIRSGKVDVRRIGVSEHLLLTTLQAGQTFGEISFMDGSRATATLTAAAPTEVLRIGHASFDVMLMEDPALGGKLWRNIAFNLGRRLSKTNQLVDHYIDLSLVMKENPSYLNDYGQI